MQSRRNFLYQSMKAGVIFSTPAFLNRCSSLPKNQLLYDPVQQAGKEGISSPIVKAIISGITAPNPHNTQAWRFKLLSETEMFLFVDKDRILPHTDPPTRQIHIGQGTFLEHLHLGASAMGLMADIQLLPQGSYSRAEVGKKPLAYVRLKPGKALQADPLYRMIPRRTTNRGTYEGNLISEQEYQSVKEIMKNVRTKMVFINGQKKINEFGKFLLEASKIETYHRPTHEETAKWFRFNDNQIYGKKDGISLRGNGMSGLKYYVVSTFILANRQDWHSASNKEAGISMFADQVESAKGLVYFQTPENNIINWVETGRDYARFQLALAERGLVMHPMSQVLQEYMAMDGLRKDFQKFTRSDEKQKIQMIVRIGRNDSLFKSPRRSYKEMLLN